MSKVRKSVSILIAASLATTSATPAMAGSWGGGYSSGYGWGHGYGKGYRHRHYRHRDRVDAGDVIGAVAVIGIIAALASSASKAKKNRTDAGYSGNRGDILSENEAVDACAVAAEREAGGRASVRDISEVDRTSDGWDVSGVVERRDNWRDPAEKRRFTCMVRFGSIDNVYIDTDTLALR